MSEAILLAKQDFPTTTLVDFSSRAGSSGPSPSYESDAPETRRRQPPIRISSVPGRFNETIQSDDVCFANPNETPDIVVLTETNASSLLARRLGRAPAAILPIVDATSGGRGTQDHRHADVTVDRASRRGIDEAVEMLRPAVRRLRSLPRDVIATEDRRLMLLARLFVRDRALTPRSEVSVRETFVYDDEVAIPGTVALAVELASQGLLERKFFDKTNVCPHCASARMTVREYCTSCGGADILEEPIVHHLKCACQGPERDFRRGGELVCPKCLQQLKNFSVDYDRPGSIGVCQSCSHLSTEHKVGFVCLDCDSRVEARNIASKTIYSYGLTAAGRACVTSGSPLPRADDLSIGGRVRTFARRHAAIGQPCSILFVRLRKPPETPDGSDAWRQTCTFFKQIMRECFTAETEIIAAAPVFLALLGRDSKAEVERHLPNIRQRLERHLSLAPRIELAVFSPEEVPGGAELTRKVA
ncbi:hypothetical protein [Rhodoblastus sp.]|uniref:TackOD1 domain-containing metal-binding protein n=1 Tax=Rhodoblastus sp. TaxID=1962975 RepID=UPI0035ADF92C